MDKDELVFTTMDVYAEATDRKKEETFEHLTAKLDELL